MPEKEYETVIGLEVHTELKTKTKIFCGCSTEFGGAPNSHTCPICLGLPGGLPKLNRQAVEFGIRAGIALNCKVNNVSLFDRKNYFYPDSALNYQISQFYQPIDTNGYLDINLADGTTKRIRINRAHLEADAGKLIHMGESVLSSEGTYVDYNRVSVPLLEIVTEPDMSSAEEAIAYVEGLREILSFVGVSDCKMEEGSIRVDVNISVREKGSNKLGVRAEIKNLNSLKHIVKAIEVEVNRHIDALENGTEILVQQTRTFDAEKGKTFAMREKVNAADYRYFPEPNIPPVIISEEWIESVRKCLPELPKERRQRMVQQYGLPIYDAEVLTSSREMSDYFDTVLEYYPDAKVISNWMMGELLKALNNTGQSINNCLVSAKMLADLLLMIEKGTINGKIAKTVLDEMMKSGKKAEIIVQEKGLLQVSDQSAVLEVVDEAIDANPKIVADYLAGKDKAIGALIGQIMQLSKGKANPQLANELLMKRLQELK
ncbi:MAG: Asp-tRNA(Asn)/Glu-tRNA(Gln) amidotransferase subunit GatB [Clostridia bacterium]